MGSFLLSHLRIGEYNLVSLRPEWFVPDTASKYINSLNIFWVATVSVISCWFFRDPQINKTWYPIIRNFFVSGKEELATMQDCAGCALHIFIIIINNMTVFQQMADKYLEEQAAFYNLHEGTIWAFRGHGQETHHFSIILNISAFSKVHTVMWYLNKAREPSHHKLLCC